MSKSGFCITLAALLLFTPMQAFAAHPHHGGGHFGGGFGGGGFHHHHHHYGGIGYGGIGYRGIGYGGIGFGLTSGVYSGGYWPGYYSSFNYYLPGYYSPSVYYGGYNPYCYSTFGYGYTTPGVVYYRPSSGYLSYALPATSTPAELNYGPQAMNQFLGVDRNFALGPLTKPPVNVSGGADEKGKLLEKLVDLADGVKVIPKIGGPPKPEPSSAAARRRAEQFIAWGDQSFRKFEPHAALQRYKQAAAAAPDMAEAFFRQGHALAATNRYDLAAAAFKRALVLDSNVERGGFHLDELYDGSALAKQSHLETLAGEALDHPDNSDLFFVLGVFLYYDGQHDRAEKFFSRAAELTAYRDHLRPFLPALPAAEKNRDDAAKRALALRVVGVSA